MPTLQRFCFFLFFLYLSKAIRLDSVRVHENFIGNLRSPFHHTAAVVNDSRYSCIENCERNSSRIGFLTF